MGLNNPLLQEDDESLCRLALQHPRNVQSAAPVTWEKLLQDGFAHWPVEDAPFAHGGFATASGQCEFVSPRLQALGQDGLPDFIPNYESPSAQDRYPLAMISPPARNFLNSSFVNVKSLRDMEGEPLLEIHPQDAAVRQLQDGEMVRVFNDRGSYECKAHVSTRVRVGMVVGLGIWWRKLGPNGTNVNELTSQKLTDMGRAPVFYDCAVQVAKR
jgi:anaerobic selenocysteine-containing dehydrogenase